MRLHRLKDRFLGVPWVYDNIRPWVVGGIDQTALADFCGVTEGDRVFDLGCGTAQLLRHLECREYVGVDLDTRALERARRVAGGRRRFIQGDGWDHACREFRPTIVLMIGLVHHLSDDEFRSIVARLTRAAGSLPTIVTIDVSFFQGQFLNNMFSRMDRGRHVRTPAAYEALFASSGLSVARRDVLYTKLRYVRYIGYHLRARHESRLRVEAV